MAKPVAGTIEDGTSLAERRMRRLMVQVELGLGWGALLTTAMVRSVGGGASQE